MRLYSLQSVLRSFVLLHFVVQVHAQSSDTEKQWFFPALPSQNVSSATSGQTIILRWSTSVQDLFDHYPDSLNADLWIAEGIFYQYRRLISGRLIEQSRVAWIQPSNRSLQLESIPVKAEARNGRLTWITIGWSPYHCGTSP